MADPALVIWLINAQDALQNAFAKATDKTGVLTQEHIEGILRGTFPKANAIVVADRMGGYRPDASSHVLRVEVQEGGKTLARVVKLGSADQIDSELKAWKSCQRSTDDRGRAFMSISAGTKGRSQSLIYEDAVQALRAGLVVSFEQAVLDCCQWGVPSVGSILMVLDQIIAEFIDRFYTRSVAINQKHAKWDKLRERLIPGSEAWSQRGSIPGGCRNFVRSSLPAAARPFVDLINFHSRLKSDRQVLPEALIGPSHGDLHGRNIHVCLVDGEARWPAVFDYEHMAPDNFLAWDFVKLECELKLRAIQQLFPEGDAGFIASVLQFELELQQETEQLNSRDFSQWKAGTEGSSERDRLKALLLGIRRLAKKCLDVVPGRARRWLHEYYFFLGSYAVHSGKFPGYTARDCQVAYLTGSVAATRYLWAISRLQFTAADARLQAKRNIISAAPHHPLVEPQNGGFEPRLAFATEYIQTKQKEFVEKAIEILAELRRQHPSVPEIVERLALANLELFAITGQTEFESKADAVLWEFRSAQEGLYETDVELLCRHGRLFKDKGDRALDDLTAGKSGTGVLVDSGSLYRLAASYYEQAYLVGKNHYPGINLATLRYLVGETEPARSLAKDILVSLDSSKTVAGSEDELWVIATRAEALRLLGKRKESDAIYRQAEDHPRCADFVVASMHKQRQRIDGRDRAKKGKE